MKLDVHRPGRGGTGKHKCWRCKARFARALYLSHHLFRCERMFVQVVGRRHRKRVLWMARS